MTTPVYNLAVFDLDGTYLRVNTWRYFAPLVLRKAREKGKLFLFLRLGCLFALRKMRLISHRAVKYRVMLASREVLQDADIEAFSDCMLRYVNEDVARETESCRRGGMITLLATAAAGEYARCIARRAGFDEVVCTPEARRGMPYRECRGEAKAMAVEEFSLKAHACVVLVATDHSDDTPLLEMYPHARHLLV